MSFKVCCTICSEAYADKDVIYSTTCGHIYHFACMQQWQARSTSCPECRSSNPGCHKIYLNFETDNEPDEKVKQLTGMVASLTSLKSDLEAKLSVIEAEFLQLQAQYTEKENQVKDLTKRNTHLTMTSEGRKEKIRNMHLKIEDLRERLLYATMESYDKLWADTTAHLNSKIPNKKPQQKAMRPKWHMGMAMPVQSSGTVNMNRMQNVPNMLAQPPNMYAQPRPNNEQIMQSSGTGNMNRFLNVPNMRAQSPITQAQSPNMYAQQQQPSNDQRFVTLAAQINGSNVPILLPRDVLLAPNGNFGASTFGNTPVNNWQDHSSQARDNIDYGNNAPQKGNYPLFQKAKELRRYGYCFVYVHKGKVFARIDKSYEPILINSAEQVNAMIEAQKM